MELVESFHAVVRLGCRALDAELAWRELVNFLEGEIGREIATQLRGEAIREDIERVRGQLTSLLAAEPPPVPLQAVYFGLFDTADESGMEQVGYYVAGIAKFDANDGDCLCNPAWWPRGRYLESSTMHAIKRAEIACKGKGRQFLAYAGQLGAALVVSRFAAEGLFGTAKTVVGFDSGDFAEVAVTTK